MPEFDFCAPRLFFDAELGPSAAVALERDQSNYLGNVLRLAAGDSVLVFNGRDGEWQAEIAGRKRPDTLALVKQTRPQDSLPDLTYAFAPLKHARLDYMVQKAVEMGASRLEPVLTRFTQVSRVNGERMRANVIEAAEVADPLAALKSDRARADGIDVLIGPEGGFAEEEHTLLLRQERTLR